MATRAIAARAVIPLLLLIPTAALAQEENVRLERFGARFTVYQQDGRGAQSQADPDAQQRGREEAWIFQPMIDFTLRQPDGVSHAVSLPVDIVTAASPDALDAISSASRENEAGTLTVTSSFETEEDQVLQLIYGAHLEEHYWSGTLGFGVLQMLAEDNAAWQTTVQFLFDTFDPIQPDGFDPGLAHRFASSVTTSLSQLLSPTTQISGGYQWTAQVGRLETSYNSVFRIDGGRAQDRFPQGRSRHALFAEVRQAIADSRTFLTARYRFYADDYEVFANTGQFDVRQYIGDFWVALRYRIHTQTAPFFWRTLEEQTLSADGFRTSDSDLEAFDAHELGGGLRWFYDRRGALTANDSYLQVDYTVYWRTNSLVSHIAGIEWGQRF